MPTPQERLAKLQQIEARNLIPLPDPLQDQIDKLNYINLVLAHSYTFIGVIRWWDRRRRELNSKSPHDYLVERGALGLDDLIHLAEGSLEMIAT